MITKCVKKILALNRYAILCQNKSILEINTKNITSCVNLKKSSSRYCFSYRLNYRVQNVIHFQIIWQNHWLIQAQRNKYTRKPSKRPEYDSDSEDSDDDLPTTADANSKTITAHLNSLRADSVIKSGLQMARNKVETAFYENNIRVNGKKLSKKSERLKIGDEIDFIKGLSPMNSNFLHISRLEILSVKARDDEEEGLAVKMRKFKTMYIEDYEQDPWKKNLESS